MERARGRGDGNGRDRGAGKANGIVTVIGRQSDGGGDGSLRILGRAVENVNEGVNASVSVNEMASLASGRGGIDCWWRGAERDWVEGRQVDCRTVA